MEINEHIVDQMLDPTGIIAGERYQFRLYLTLDEEDELYAEGGTGLRVIFAVDGDEERIASYHFLSVQLKKFLILN